MKPEESTAAWNNLENNVQVQDLLVARVALHEIRADLYRYICSPAGRETVKSGFHPKFSLMQSKTSSNIHTAPLCEKTDGYEDFRKVLTLFEDLVYDATSDIDTGKEHEIIASLNDGHLYHAILKIDEFLVAMINVSETGIKKGEPDILQAQVTALFTIIEIIGAIAVMFPGVFVSIGVPATLAKSAVVLNQVQKVYPGVQLVLDRKQEIMILAGTMTAFAGGMHKNAARLLQQMAVDENVKKITIMDDTGKAIPASEIVQYALDLQTSRSELPKDAPVPCQSEQSPGTEAEPDMFMKFTRLVETITNPVGESLKAADNVAHQGIQDRLDDVNQGKEFILQVPLVISNMGVSVGTDISAKIRELSEKVGSLKGKDATEDKQP